MVKSKDLREEFVLDFLKRCKSADISIKKSDKHYLLEVCLSMEIEIGQFLKVEYLLASSDIIEVAASASRRMSTKSFLQLFMMA